MKWQYEHYDNLLKKIFSLYFDKKIMDCPFLKNVILSLNEIMILNNWPVTLRLLLLPVFRTFFHKLQYVKYGI